VVTVPLGLIPNMPYEASGPFRFMWWAIFATGCILSVILTSPLVLTQSFNILLRLVHEYVPTLPEVPPRRPRRESSARGRELAEAIR